MQVFLIVLHCGRSSKVKSVRLLTQLIIIDFLKSVIEKVQVPSYFGSLVQVPVMMGPK